MNSVSQKSIIGIVCCQKELGGYQIQAVNQFYIDAITAYGGIPLLLTSTMTQQDIEQLLENIDGLLFPGSHSNVAPYHYDAEHHEAYMDESRDELAFSLIRIAIDKNIPSLGICRGFQEMNVALGGSLHPKVHEVGFDDHRELSTDDFDAKYAPRHPVYIEPQGVLSSWLKGVQTIDVNTLHSQGINELAPPLKVEAKAPDGLIEAFSLEGQRYFVGVQWHPEWQATKNHFSQLLFKQFMIAASQ